MPKITKKIDDTQAEKMLLQGVSQSKIAKHFGVSASAVSSWVKSYYAKKNNRKCPTCKYREKSGRAGNCNYMAIVGHSRGCSAENCTVYEEGNPS